MFQAKCIVYIISDSDKLIEFIIFFSKIGEKNRKKVTTEMFSNSIKRLVIFET